VHIDVLFFDLYSSWVIIFRIWVSFLLTVMDKLLSQLEIDLVSCMLSSMFYKILFPPSVLTFVCSVNLICLLIDPHKMNRLQKLWLKLESKL
jgi:hypothetical protein